MTSPNGSPSHAGRSFDTIVVVLVAALFAVAQWRLLQQALGVSYELAYQSAKSVVLGTPGWRIVQSRVLGPYAVEALTLLLPGYARCFMLFNMLCLTVAGCLAYYTGTLLNRRIGGLVGFLLFQSLFALCLDRNLYFVWDSIDIVIFYAFFILVIRGASWRWTALLFAVAVFNRESALFIALWLMLDPLCRWAVGRLGYGPAVALDGASVIAGVVCMVLGIVAIETLRSTLLIEELGLRTGAPHVYGPHVFQTFQLNVRAILATMSLAHRDLAVIVPAFMIVILVLIVRLATARPAIFLGAALMYLAQLVAVLIVGLVFETRVFLDFIPFVTVATVALMTRDTEQTDRAAF